MNKSEEKGSLNLTIGVVLPPFYVQGTWRWPYKTSPPEDDSTILIPGGVPTQMPRTCIVRELKRGQLVHGFLWKVKGWLSKHS